jgi:hypothetical protein
LVILAMIVSSRLHAANLQLRWENTSTDQTAITIERQTGASYVQIASVAPTTQSYSDSGLSDGTTYCYRVRSVNPAGTSAYSNSACANTPLPTGTTTPPPTETPPPPTSTPTGGSVATQTWSDYRFAVNMSSSDSQALGVIFRYQDQDNYYRFSWCAAAPCRRLEKQVKGVFKVLAQDNGSYTVGQTYNVQITGKGSSLQVAIDGKTIFTVNDSSFPRGGVGLYSNNNAGSSFDNVTVEDLASGAILLSSDFNDTSRRGWTIIDEGASGGPSQWSAASGAMVQTSKIGSSDASALGTFALYTHRPWKDYRASFAMKSADDDRLGMMFRYQDSDNFYRFVWNQGSPGRRLLKKENGVFTTLAEDAVPYTTNQSYKIEIVAQGSTMTVNIDGKPIFATTDTSFATGSIAFYSSYNQGAKFDNLLVEDLINKTVLLSTGFGSSSLAGWTIVDEGGTTEGPSAWKVINGALVQSSNIGSDANGYPGTFLLY